jgi:hypothetical protein
MAKTHFERHSVALALSTYLVGKGWAAITEVKEGFPDEGVEIPSVSITFLRSNQFELQLGREDSSQKSYLRPVQIDAWMESESRASAIIDDVADFFDEQTIVITKPDASAVGVIYCENSETIETTTMPPILTQPSVNRWRGIVRCELNAYYNLEVPETYYIVSNAMASII